MEKNGRSIKAGNGRSLRVGLVGRSYGQTPTTQRLSILTLELAVRQAKWSTIVVIYLQWGD
jgi:hypothetical protein